MHKGLFLSNCHDFFLSVTSNLALSGFWFFFISVQNAWVRAPCPPPAEFHYSPFVISSMNRSSIVDGLIIDFTLKSLNLCFMSDSEELIIYISPIIEVPEKELILIIDYAIDYDTSHCKEVSPNHIESFPCLITGNNMLLPLYFSVTFHPLLSFCPKDLPCCLSHS